MNSGSSCFLLWSLNVGFITEGSTITNLLVYNGFLQNHLDNDQQVDSIYIVYSKAFDLVNHNRLLSELHNLGDTGGLLLWIRSYSSDRKHYVGIKGIISRLFSPY